MSTRGTFNSCLSELQILEFRRGGHFKPQEVRVIRQHIATCNICAFLHEQAGTSNFFSLFNENINRFLSNLKESLKKIFQHYSTKYFAIILVSALIAPIVLFNIKNRNQAVSLKTEIQDIETYSEKPVLTAPMETKIPKAEPIKQTLVSKIIKKDLPVVSENPAIEKKSEQVVTEQPSAIPVKEDPAPLNPSTLPENLFQLNF